MNLLFHIIFIPGSVKYLRYGVLSLLKYSDYRYCVVSNGLGREEHAILEKLVSSNDRLSLKGSPGTRLLAHGDMVNQLFRECTEDWFCFMDNDIFATARFQEKLEKELAECDVFSSAYTIGADPEEAGSGYMGLHLKTPGGLPLPVTHLCVYPVKKLRALIEETGVGFEHHQPSKHMPEVASQPGFPEDLSNVHKLDTGVLMNILAGMRGWEFRFTDLNELVHIGSIAGYTKRQMKWSKRLKQLLSFSSNSYVLTDKNLDVELEKRLKRRAKKHGSIEEKDIVKERQYVTTKILRNRIATYFLFLFKALLEEGKMPTFDLGDRRLESKVKRSTEVLKELVTDYGEHGAI